MDYNLGYSAENIPSRDVFRPIARERKYLLDYKQLYIIGALHDPVTWYKITYTGEQVAQWDFQNKGASDEVFVISRMIKFEGSLHLPRSRLFCHLQIFFQKLRLLYSCLSSVDNIKKISPSRF